MKSNFIKYKVENQEVLSPISSCTFYSNCIVIEASPFDYQVIVVPNGEWEYFEEPIIIHDYTYEEFMNYEIYKQVYFQELNRKRREWLDKTNSKSFKDFDIELAEKFDDYVLQLYNIPYAFTTLEYILENKESLPEWAKSYKGISFNKVLSEVKLNIERFTYWKNRREESQKEIPNECLSIETWLEQAKSLTTKK